MGLQEKQGRDMGVSKDDGWPKEKRKQRRGRYQSEDRKGMDPQISQNFVTRTKKTPEAVTPID